MKLKIRFRAWLKKLTQDIRNDNYKTCGVALLFLVSCAAVAQTAPGASVTPAADVDKQLREVNQQILASQAAVQLRFEALAHIDALLKSQETLQALQAKQDSLALQKNQAAAQKAAPVKPAEHKPAAPANNTSVPSNLPQPPKQK